MFFCCQIVIKLKKLCFFAGDITLLMTKSTGIFILLWAITIQAGAVSWTSKVDSLENLIPNEKSDSGKFELYIKIIDDLLNNTPSDAFDYIQKAKNLADQTHDTFQIVRSLTRLSDFYTQMGEYSISLENAYHALDLSKNNKKLQSLCHNRIARIHASLKNFREALEHNRMSMLLYKQIGDTTGMIVDFQNMGSSFLDLKQYDSALYYLRMADSLSIVRTGEHDTYAASSLGLVFIETKQLDSALYYHRIAYEIDSSQQQQFLMALDEQYISLTYFKMKKYDLAQKYAFKSIARADSIKAYDIKIDNYEVLYKTYEAEQDFPAALKYCLLFSQTKDTLRIKNNASLILGLEAKYKVREQENKLEANEAAVTLLEKQKTLLLIIVVISILFLISVFIFAIMVYRRQSSNKKLMHELKMADDSKERMISIISHDLRSSVGSLRNAAQLISEGIIEGNDTTHLLESFYPVADSTYDLLENLLTWTQYSKGKLNTSFRHIQLADVVKKTINHTTPLAESKNIKLLDSTTDQKLYADQNMILCVLRNLISNAIKFSYPDTKVVISSRLEDNLCVVSVTDQGVGIKEEVLGKIFESPQFLHSSGTMGERGSGLGIALCKTFVQKHGGRIWAESTPDKGSTFFFSIPVNTKQFNPEEY